ncbi:CPBP family intramembrane glutamic endopeptidase [Pontibacter actiniarum]|uniref:CPBP family intramembrane metalloprotease n=1 Tax=Pontibacter actiniarum TaxID=323450 RepID=A0A1X9YMM6_9BACT|nr:type II CAAX endopeptidase family protein [Pontibacter actiniarum]ARS34104.1 CPBP family intramembrane metalloprotease [Pontibacter actiniarum]
MALTSTSVEVLPASTPPETTYSLAGAWGFVGVLLLTFFGGSVVSLGLALALGHPTSESFLTFVGYTIPFLLYAWYLKRKGLLSELLAAVSRWQPGPLLLYPLLVLLVPSIQVVIEPVTSLIPMPESVKEMFLSRLGGGDLFTVLTVVVAAPVLEEVVLRGQLLRSLLHKYSAAKAITWSSIMFAVIHMNPWQGVGAFVLGLFLGWIYYRTRSLWACIFFHFVNNLFSTVMIQLMPEGADKFATLYEQVGDATAYTLIYGAAVVVLLAVIVCMSRTFKGLGEEAELVKESC